MASTPTGLSTTTMGERLIKQVVCSESSNSAEDDFMSDMSADETLREKLSRSLRKLAREVAGGVDSTHCPLQRLVRETSPWCLIKGLVWSMGSQWCWRARVSE